MNFALTAPAEADFPVALTVNPTPPGPGGFPQFVMIPAGNATYQINFAAPGGGGGTFTLTASAGGVYLTTTLILP